MDEQSGNKDQRVSQGLWEVIEALCHPSRHNQLTGANNDEPVQWQLYGTWPDRLERKYSCDGLTGMVVEGHFDTLGDLHMGAISWEPVELPDELRKQAVALSELAGAALERIASSYIEIPAGTYQEKLYYTQQEVNDAPGTGTYKAVEEAYQAIKAEQQPTLVELPGYRLELPLPMEQNDGS